MIASCPQCRARYRLDASRLSDGRGRLRCAKCQTVFPVSVESAAEEPAAEEPAAKAEQDRQPEAVERLLEASRGRSTGLAVAVVGCEPGGLRERIVSALARAGVRTLTTDDGPTCLDMARRTHPRLVVAASYLQGMTGPELAVALRSVPGLARTRILLLGAGGDTAPPPGTLCVDAIAPSSLIAEDLELLLRDLLAEKRPEARPDEDEDLALDRACRVLAQELLLYHADGQGRLVRGPALEADLAAAREWAAERWPGREHTARLLLEAELEASLGPAD